MPTRYDFSPDEFFPVHPSCIDALREELSACLEVFDFIMGHTCIEGETGLYEALDMLRERLEQAVNRVEPEAIRAMLAGLEEEMGHAKQ